MTMLSSADALLLLNKWNQESSHLECTMLGTGVTAFVSGTIKRVDPDEAFALESDDKGSGIMVFLNRALFLEYGDHRSVSDPAFQNVAKKYAGVLTMRTDGGTLIAIGELK